jgi:hypothetical protein
MVFVMQNLVSRPCAPSTKKEKQKNSRPSFLCHTANPTSNNVPVYSSAWLCIQRKSFASSHVNDEILCFAVDWMG